jgi:Fur family iron response transcriptional regulator
MDASAQPPALTDTALAERLQQHGVRATAQRMRVARILLAMPQHLSADQVAAAMRRAGTRVSKATIYNTLHLFVERGLVRQLAVGSLQACFDSNTHGHYHFQDESTGALSDVPLPAVEFARLPEPPPGMEVAGIDLVIRLRRK